MAKFMDSANLLAGPANLEVTPGQYGALMLRVVGLTAAGAAPTLANFGLIRASVNGRPFYAVTWVATQAINAIDLGLVESAIGAAGGNPITLSALIVSSRVADGNVFDVASGDNMTVSCDLGGISVANVASGTVTLYGVDQEGTQLYVPQMFTNQPNIAASTREMLSLAYENVAGIYVVTLTNLDRILVMKDSVVRYDAEVAALLALSNLEGRVEAAYTAALRMPLHRSGALSEALCDKVSMQIATTAGGAATPEVVTLSLDFTPDVLARSAAVTEGNAANRFRAKAASGKSRPVTVAKMLTGASAK